MRNMRNERTKEMCNDCQVIFNFAVFIGVKVVVPHIFILLFMPR